MKRVYSAKSPIHAHILVEVLEHHGIPALVQDEEMFNIRGEIPVVYPSIAVADEVAEKAREICEAYDKHGLVEFHDDTWTCPKCGENIAAEFTECWKCADEAAENTPPPLRTPKHRAFKWMILVLVLIGIGYAVVSNFNEKKKQQAWLTSSAAISALEKGDYARALAGFNEALEFAPKEPSAYYNRAIAYGYLKQFDKAAADYTRALDMNLKQPESAYINRALIYIHLKQRDKAIEDLNRAVDGSRSAAAFAYRAHYWMEQGSLENTLKDLQEALNRDSNHSYALFLRGCIHMENGEMEKASEVADRMIKHDPRNFLSQLMQGNVLLAKDKLPDAVAAFSKSVELYRSDVTALATCSLSYIYMGEFTEAAAGLSKAIELDSKMTVLYKLRAQLFRLKGDEEKALSDIDSILKLDPHWHFDYMARGYAHAWKGDMSKAKADILHASEMHPWGFGADYNFAVIHCLHARALPVAQRTADLEKAVEHLLAGIQKGLKSWKAIKHDPDLRMLKDDHRVRALFE